MLRLLTEKLQTASERADCVRRGTATINTVIAEAETGNIGETMKPVLIPNIEGLVMMSIIVATEKILPQVGTTIVAVKIAADFDNPQFSNDSLLTQYIIGILSMLLLYPKPSLF